MSEEHETSNMFPDELVSHQAHVALRANMSKSSEEGTRFFLQVLKFSKSYDHYIYLQQIKQKSSINIKAIVKIYVIPERARV